MGFLSRLTNRTSLAEKLTDEAFVLTDAGRSNVVGEFYYQEALRATKEVTSPDPNPRSKGGPTFEALLVLEPKNPHDAQAVAIHSQCGQIGHTPRGSEWFELLTELKRRGKPAAKCRAHLTSGSEHIYGAVLHADAAKELAALDTRAPGFG